MEAIRFAPLIRVSTEKQDKQGESLKTQTSQIRQYVQSLGGIIPSHCWGYSGQEHATPDQERTRLDLLLKDSGKGLFDAVIVCDASRWSRDNLKRKEGLNVLRSNGIRFFVGSMEYDLYNPEHKFFLGMSAEIGEYQARIQELKSIINRINRAKRGIPTAGKLPYGRTYDELKGWGIDKEKQQMIQQAAKRYLSGEGISQIASTFKMNPSNLHKILTKRSGSEWECTFVNKKINVEETVIMQIPSLLDEETIKAIHERVRTNKTYERGNRKYDYLLSGMVFCNRCGYSMASYRNHTGKQYYRHSKNGTGCTFNRLIPATELENSVLIQLVRTFGDPEKIQKAIQRATPDLTKVEGLSKEKNSLFIELKKVISQKNRIVDLAAEGVLNKTEIQARMPKLREQETAIKNRLVLVESELTSIPNPDRVKRVSMWAGRITSSITRDDPSIIFKRSYQWKRKLIENAFSGVNPLGQHLGVYVDFTNEVENVYMDIKVKRQFTFEIRGIFESTINTLPLGDQELVAAFHIDTDFQDVSEELAKIRENIQSNIQGECYAYYCQCFY